MHFLSDTCADGVTERLFRHGPVPGALWSPAGSSGPRPLVLLGHGGGQHKTAPSVTARARRLVTGCGFAAAAIDAPGHGDRPRTSQDEELVTRIRARIAAGEPASRELARYHAVVTGQLIPDWRSVLDGLRAAGITGAADQAAYWGVSLGGWAGIRLTAAEPRIAAAVLGLAGDPALRADAARITVPVRFLLQWDDEQVPRDEGLALFGALGSAEKTLHANPGRHHELPAFEHDSSVRFLRRQLAREQPVDSAGA